jgi:DNA-binding transcriptional ArsR family regulator
MSTSTDLKPRASETGNAVDGAVDMAEMAGQAQKAAEVLKALSHQTRLLLLCAMVDGERSVSELEDVLGLPQSTVSQQLARLRLDRLVETRRDGRMIYYSIADPDVARLIGSLHDIFCGQLKDRA